MRRQIPSLTALRAFEAAARLSSFRAAAEELSITQSAVSHQIAGLEERLGTALFHRTARRVELTEAGALYYPFLRDAFDRISQGTDLVLRVATTDDLMVQVYVTVAARWLIPRLHHFQAVNPDILVRFNTSHFHWHFDPSTADLGMVCTDDTGDPSYHFTFLAAARLEVVCSPALVEQGLARPADLADHALLQLFNKEEDWDVWRAAAGLRHLKGRSHLNGRAVPKFDSYLLALAAAIDGQGVALAPHFLVAEDLKDGRLVRPFDISAKQPGGWYLVCRKERAEESRIQRFTAWMQEQIVQDPDFI
ncbi:MAG: LysR family transcriptional regulator [Rhodospirillaceae bacterium]|nr:MAG: LysR family transcriptional regulator [Rhodospirillaceae bacterium]